MMKSKHPVLRLKIIAAVSNLIGQMLVIFYHSSSRGEEGL